MREEEVPWTRKAVFICTKCHKSFAEGMLKQEGNCGENLKNNLKAEMKKLNIQNEVRVMTSSCLNVCEPAAQAFCIQEVLGSKTQTFTAHPELEYAEILQLITD